MEPSGAVTLAAVLAGKVGGSGPVLAVLSGGNVDPLLLIKLIDHGLSAASGQCVQLPRVETMADGIAVKSPSPLTLAHVLAYVEDLVTVTEEEISQAVLLLLERAKASIHSEEVVGDLQRLGYSVDPIR